MSTVRAQIQFTEEPTTISGGGSGYTLRDEQGNSVTLSLNTILRCLAIAQHEKAIPQLPAEFWAAVDRNK